jgi:hypothetical protein
LFAANGVPFQLNLIPPPLPPVKKKSKEASDEKTPALDANSPPIKPSSDNSTLKTNAKEKPVTGVRSLRRSNKNPTNNNTMQ